MRRSHSFEPQVGAIVLLALLATLLQGTGAHAQGSKVAAALDGTGRDSSGGAVAAAAVTGATQLPIKGARWLPSRMVRFTRRNFGRDL